jgi:anaerobic selenocysteine-containing dehydrogenase
MMQEILTYLIIAIAAGTAIWRFYKTLSVKKKKKVTDLKKEKFTMQHNCSDCAAGCTIRNASPTVKQENEEICETNVKPIDS